MAGNANVEKPMKSGAERMSLSGLGGLARKRAVSPSALSAVPAPPVDDMDTDALEVPDLGGTSETEVGQGSESTAAASATTNDESAAESLDVASTEAPVDASTEEEPAPPVMTLVGEGPVARPGHAQEVPTPPVAPPVGRSTAAMPDVEVGHKQTRVGRPPTAGDRASTMATSLSLPVALIQRWNACAHAFDSKVGMMLTAFEELWDEIPALVEADGASRRRTMTRFTHPDRRTSSMVDTRQMSLRTIESNWAQLDAIVESTGARNRSDLVRIVVTEFLNRQGVPE